MVGAPASEVRQATRLFRAFRSDSAWEHVARPWFADHSRDLLTADLPCAVVVPSFQAIRFLKSRLLSEGIESIGTHVLSHFEAWNMLREACGAPSPATREDLHLLLSTAAEQHPGQATARSVARDASSLMRALDLTAASGWQADVLESPSTSGILAGFRNCLAAAGLTTAQVVDRQLAKRAGREQCIFGSILLLGFDARHWPLWNSLHALVAASERADVCLLEPRMAAGALDEVWINSWEDALGEASIVLDQAPASLLAPLFQAMESGGHSDAGAAVFRIGEHTSQEAHAIVAQVVSFLASGECDRIGILFPGESPLARETACLLAQHGIPHNDSLGFNLPTPLGEDAWGAWLRLQEQPRIQPLLALLDACPGASGLVAAKPNGLGRSIQRAYDELMVDDIAVIGSHLGIDLTPWPMLPIQAPFADFLAITADALAQLPETNAGNRSVAVHRAGARFAKTFQQRVTRDTFVRWISALTLHSARGRSDSGNHPYSRVHLLTYDEAEWQSWSHLIVAGLNRNSWPPEYRPQPFLGQELIDSLNRKAMRQSSHGQDTYAIKPGKALIIGPAERAAHVRRQFYTIMESCRTAACFTASRTRQDVPGQNWNPSDLLVSTHAAAVGEGLSDELMTRLQTATSQWLADGPVEPLRFPGRTADDESSSADLPSPDQTRRAYIERRDESGPFGIYEFALESVPDKEIELSCTAWERAYSFPELAWLEHFLGVHDTRWTAAEMPAAKLVGTWVHAWLNAALSPGDSRRAGFHSLPGSDEVTSRLRAAQDRTLAQATAAFAGAGAELPHWLRHLHTQASTKSRELATEIARLIADGWNRGKTEWTLPPGASAHIDGKSFPLVGRIDLALAKTDDGPYWIIDYKTGSGSAVSATGLSSGGGLQILLYSLALMLDGSFEVRLTFARPGEPIDSHAVARELLDDERVRQTLSALAHMQRTGVFGLKGDPRPEFGYAPEYPLAHLPINLDILARKWELTFEP